MVKSMDGWICLITLRIYKFKSLNNILPSKWTVWSDHAWMVCASVNKSAKLRSPGSSRNRQLGFGAQSVLNKEEAPLPGCCPHWSRSTTLFLTHPDQTLQSQGLRCSRGCLISKSRLLEKCVLWWVTWPRCSMADHPSWANLPLLMLSCPWSGPAQWQGLWREPSQPHLFGICQITPL